MATDNLNERAIADCIQEAQNKSVQLHALLASIVGEGGESFRILSDSLQDNFLWACRDIARDLSDMIETANVKALKLAAPTSL